MSGCIRTWLCRRRHRCLRQSFPAFGMHPRRTLCRDWGRWEREGVGGEEKEGKEEASRSEEGRRTTRGESARDHSFFLPIRLVRRVLPVVCKRTSSFLRSPPHSSHSLLSLPPSPPPPQQPITHNITMASEAQASSAPASTAPIGKDGKPLKPCCACPETKKARDQCVFNLGEENCLDMIKTHQQCLRDLGFKI